MANRSRQELQYNVGFGESLVRGGLAVLTPPFYFLIDHWLMFILAPVNMYLFVSAMCHFCFFRYFWDRIRHVPEPVVTDFAVA
jgi:hypothetical protein